MTTLGIVGAGTMGAGIAQVALAAGDEVRLHDMDAEAFGRARERIASGLARRADRLGTDADSVATWVEGCLASLRAVDRLGDLASGADLVIEAAPEVLDLKQAVFRSLDAAAGADVILATNTSALSVAAIAAATRRPERVLGLHCFNPVPAMALVEVVVTERVAPRHVERAEAIVRAWGKVPIHCADTPGFIVNRVNRPFTIEALRMLEASAASVEAIDAAMRADGFPLGPFELMDLTGVDVSLAAATAVWEGLGRPGRLRPSSIQGRLVEVGALGRKAGHGFYVYRDGLRGPVADAFASPPGAERLPATAIAARITAAVADEARRVVDEGVATAADVGLALRLGAGHPRDPLA